MYKNSVFSAHPDFALINDSPEFHQFLQGADADGISRGVKLSGAHQALNAAVVIGLINQFKISAGQQEQATQQRQGAIERQLSPSRSRGGSGQPASQQKYLTPQQINQFRDRFNRDAAFRNGAEWQKLEPIIERSEQYHLENGHF